MSERENWERVKIEHLVPTKWGWMVSYPDNLTLGDHVDIGAFTYIQAKNQVDIDDDVQIGSHCSIYSESTIDNKQGPVIIERGAKIGSHSLITPGSIIPAGTLVPAFSYVSIKGIRPLERSWRV